MRLTKDLFGAPPAPATGWDLLAGWTIAALIVGVVLWGC